MYIRGKTQCSVRPVGSIHTYIHTYILTDLVRQADFTGKVTIDVVTIGLDNTPVISDCMGHAEPISSLIRQFTSKYVLMYDCPLPYLVIERQDSFP